MVTTSPDEHVDVLIVGAGLSGVGAGYHLGIRRNGRDIVEEQPVFRKNDPNCCPSGGFDHRRWHWDGAKLAVLRSWHTRSP